MLSPHIRLTHTHAYIDDDPPKSKVKRMPKIYVYSIYRRCQQQLDANITTTETNEENMPEKVPFRDVFMPVIYTSVIVVVLSTLVIVSCQIKEYVKSC